MDKAWIVYEEEDCKLMDKAISAFELGTEVIESMNQFSVKDTNLRDTKLTDWRALSMANQNPLRIF
ncbi:MAG TPA: hypothetical protein VK796_05050 [Cytophaga sp.]|jgi:hypothetical protein|nr:hypothetical protein [Cytophaga sp.]